MPEGYQVDAERVAAAGRGACELAEALRAARSRWDGATRDGDRACGMDVTARAYTTMQDAWFDEIGVHIRILEQVCGALNASAQAYQSHDQAAAAGFTAGASADVVQ
jgi:hypothetical protein